MNYTCETSIPLEQGGGLQRPCGINPEWGGRKRCLSSLKVMSSIINTPCILQTLTTGSLRRWRHHQNRDNVWDPSVVSMIGGATSHLCNVFDFLLLQHPWSWWKICSGVLCPAYGLQAHMCVIMAESTHTKPFYPSSKVIRMWELMSKGDESLDHHLLSSACAKVKQ